jgi:CIC family chloride channel protein
MENTIMTEKIARRAISTPDSFEPDILQKMYVSDVISDAETVINANTTLSEIRDWLSTSNTNDTNFIVVNNHSEYAGTIKLADIYNTKIDDNSSLKDIVNKPNIAVNNTDTLRRAVEQMSKSGAEILPVLSDGRVIGVLTYKNIINAYGRYREKSESAHIRISLKRQRIKMLIKGKRLIDFNSDN